MTVPDALRAGACECGGDLVHSSVVHDDFGAAMAQVRSLGIALHLSQADMPIRVQFLLCTNSPGRAPVLPDRPQGCQRRGVKITNKAGLLYQSGRKP